MPVSSLRSVSTPLAATSQDQAPPTVVLVGTSFRTAKIGFREKVAERLGRLKSVGGPVTGLQEVSILSTCNRLEIYGVSTSAESATAALLGMLGSGSTEGFYVRAGPEAIKHIFRVAAGLDSLVVGEEQILRQVRTAGIEARSAGEARSVLAALFDAAYNSAQRARKAYRTAASRRSVSETALKLALRKLGKKPSKVLIAGTGETAKLTALQLKGASIYLFSHRREAKRVFPNALRVSRSGLRRAASKCDLIISATRSEGYVFSTRDVPDDRKKVVLDLGFPRNVDPALKASKFIRLLDLDDLASGVVSGGTAEALSEVEKAAEGEAAKFYAWLTATRLNPTLASVYRWAEKVRREEALSALRRLPDVSERDKKVVEVMSRRLVSRLMAPHAAFVKETARGADQAERLRLLETIFGGDGMG